MKKILTIDASRSHKSENLLDLVDKDLKKCHTKIGHVSDIKLILNKKSYTGSRIAALIANVLNYLLKIPINGKNKPIFPKYQ